MTGGPKAKDDRSPTDDSFEAGPGNDLILAADHDKDNRIDCGPGRQDVAVIDRIDPKPTHCEKVRGLGLGIIPGLPNQNKAARRRP